MSLLQIVGAVSESLSVGVFIGLLSVLVVAYYLSIAVYNVYFHPLSKFPGPKLAAATHLWYARCLARGTAPIEMSKLHDQYGPVVRVAPDELSYSSPTAWKAIYGHKRPGQPELSKDKKYHASIAAEPVLLNADREYHSALRKLLAHGFSEASLRAQESVLQTHLGLLMEQLKKKGSDGKVSLDVEKWYNYFTFDFIGYLTHGESFGCLASGVSHPYITLLLSFIKFAAHGQAIQRLPLLLKLPYAKWHIPKKINEAVARKNELNTAKVNYRLSNSSGIPDFMDKLIDTYQAGKMTFGQLLGNSEVLIAAGSETTATLLSGITYLLMMHPRVLQKLTAEIRGQFSTSQEITAVGVNKCNYLLACIEEALRVYPPSPATHPRYTPEEGISIDGQFVPGNMAVGITIYAACHSRLNFRNPDQFVPERWVDTDSEYKNDRKEAAQVFSYGPRNCIGRNLAYLEMRLVIANLLWHFDLENCSGDDWLDQKIYMVWEKKPLMVKLKPVQRI